MTLDLIAFKSEVNLVSKLKETLVMVADYTEEEKNKILNKVFTYGAVSTVAFISLLIMFAFNLTKKKITAQKKTETISSE